ncbi:MAG: ferritin-like domain-containing protein [Armatimonadota bacterium]
MAIEIERQGLAFYQGCVAARATESVAEVFDYAAEQQRRYIERFSKMKRDLAEYSVPEGYPGETVGYLRGFISGRLFTSVDDASCSAEAVRDELEAVELAVELERSTIAFYSGVKQIVRESERDVIDEIISEQHRHIRRLLQLRNQLERGEA